MLGLNPLLAAGLVFLAVSSLLAGTYAIGRRDGGAAAVAEIRRANDAAANAAREARESLVRECRADPDRCLSDAWTRDR